MGTVGTEGALEPEASRIIAGTSRRRQARRPQGEDGWETREEEEDHDEGEEKSGKEIC